MTAASPGLPPGEVRNHSDHGGDEVVRLTDHFWAGDDDGHNCFTCQERDDSLYLCWPQAHPCAICEKVPLAWPDVMCVECRRRVDRSGDEVVDPVELVLSSHQHVCGLSDIDGTMCACTEHFEGGPGFHRRHVAEKVYEALGIEGPKPWLLGPDSLTRQRAGFERFPVASELRDVLAGRRPPAPSPETQRAQREEAIEAIAQVSIAWRADTALPFIRRYLEHHPTMFVDDLWTAGLPEPHDRKALGPALREAARLGWIEQTNEWRVSVSNSNRKPIWRSLLIGTAKENTDA